MASNFVEEFVVGLGFQFEGEDGERFKKQTERISSALNALTTAAAAALTATFAAAKGAGDAADKNNKVATSLDTSTKALTRWQYAAEKATGAGGEAVDGMLQGLKQISQEAVRSGSGPFRAFQELGVDFQGIADGSVDVTDALDRIIEKAQQLDRATAQPALRELGIDVKFLDTPIAELRSYMEEFDKWGRVTDSLAKKGGDLDDAWDSMGVRLQGLRNELGERTLPTFTKFFEVLNQGLEWLLTDGFPIMDKFVEKCGGWDKVLGGLALVALPALIGTLGTLFSLITKISGGFTAAAGAAKVFGAAALLGGAGYGGYKVGEMINDKLPQDLKDDIGEYIAKSLAFLGVQEAKDAVNTMEGRYSEVGSSAEALGVDRHDAWESNRQLQADYEAARRAHPEDYPPGSGSYAQPSGSNPDAADRLRDVIIGRESGGNTNAESNKGAAGLMQLMPGTAQETAGELGLPYDQARLKSDPEYNKTLGTAYLRKMLDRYSGSEGLAIAAYNAGPGSVDGWLKDNGDPRKGDVSMADWIAKIPYKETREYTANVLADKARIVPPELQQGGAGFNGGGAAGSKTTTNNFYGMKQAEIESMLQRAEDEQQTLMANEAKDAIVR